MSLIRRTVVLLAAVCAFSGSVNVAQPLDSSGASITFDFARHGEGVPVPKYKLTIREDGSGSYEGEALPPPTRYGPAASSAAIPFHRDLRITSGTARQIFRLSEQLEHFNRVCASKAKNIADTGTKILTYKGPDGTGTCTYNYTDSKPLQSLTDMLQGITETLDEGRELDRLHRYDRLGLDAAITFFSQEISAGRALEVGTIEATLRSIAEDEDVMARVRARAGTLLSQVEQARTQAH